MIAETVAVVIGTIASIVTLWEYAQRQREKRSVRPAPLPQKPDASLHPALSTPLSNLPRHQPSFIGRERELAETLRLLSETCLLTLTGSGGCGKTRLAIEAASRAQGDYPDGVWLVEFAGLSEADRVVPAIAAVVGVREEPDTLLLDSLITFLKEKRLLLVFDNCEHLLAECGDVAAAILREAPHASILASSREPLGVAGEATYRVPSLGIPHANEDVSPESLDHYESARLFIERAKFSQPDFVVTQGNAHAIAQVCERLDGIPLAIELAAARVKAASVEQIADRLDDRFRLLTGGARTALPRQRTLRALIDWSYDLLSQAERTFLRRLAVFVGGWSLEAAQAVASEDGDMTATLDLLQHLVDKSLVQRETGDGAARFRMLETVRQYSRDRLEESGEWDSIRRRHRDYLLKFVTEAEPYLRGPEQAEWLSRLETEHDNLRAALEWSKTEEGDADHGLRLAGALWPFWLRRGHLAEGRALCAALLARREARAPTEARARALNCAAILAYTQGDFPAAGAYAEEELAIARRLGDEMDVAVTLNKLGNVLLLSGDFTAAAPVYEEALAIGRAAGDRNNIAGQLTNLGLIAFEQGDFGRSRALQEEALALQRELGDGAGIAGSLNNLGMVAVEEGYAAAARPFHTEALTRRRAIGDRLGVAESLNAFAALGLLEGRHDRAARLFGAADALRETLGVPLPPPDKARADRDVAKARAALGDARFAALFKEGRALPLETAMQLALITKEA